MKSTFIIITFLFFISTFVSAYLCSTTVLNKKDSDTLTKEEKIHLLVSFTLALSIIIYMATISLFLGLLTFCLFSGLFFTTLFIISKWLREFVTIIFLTFFSIVVLSMLALFPIIDGKSKKVSEEVIKLEKYTNSSKNTIVFELTKDKQKLYSVMEYDSKTDLPFILYDEDIKSYKISKKKEEKIVIKKFERKTYTVLEYFGFTKPTVNSYSEYDLYLNKDSITYD